MRAYRKRSWSSLGLNVTPLIDVIFLMNIFFLLTINFSDVISRSISLPKADEAKAADQRAAGRIAVTVKSADAVFIGTRSMPLAEVDAGIAEVLLEQSLDPQKTVVQVLCDENLPYEAVQTVLQKAALRGISRIEFSALIEPAQPLTRETGP
jgi:biopolymer transport protein ExbD